MTEQYLKMLSFIIHMLTLILLTMTPHWFPSGVMVMVLLMKGVAD